MTYNQSSEQAQLYSVVLPDGAPIKLNGPLAADESVGDFDFSPDDSYVAFTIYSGEYENAILYRADPLSGDRQLLVDPAAGGVSDFLFTPDSARLVYSVYEDDYSLREIWVVAATGGAPAKVNGPLVAGGGVDRYNISPDGQRVVYTADQEIDQVDELYAATIPDEPAAEIAVYLPVAIR